MNVQRYLTQLTARSRGLALFSMVTLTLGLSGCGRDDGAAQSGGEGITQGDDPSGIDPSEDDVEDGSEDSSKSPSEDDGPAPLPPGGGSNDDSDSSVVPGEGTSDEPPCEIDFLFVIDHSGSMESEQDNLKNAVPKFIETVKKDIDELEDYHIAVVTTGSGQGGMGGFGSPGCEKIGAMVTKTQGMNSSNADCGPYANGKKFMTKGDDLEETFVCAAKPGTSGDGNERPMDAMVAAVSDELNTKECNGGFLRKEALLVVTIITDEEDDGLGQGPGGDFGSAGDPKDWYKALVKAKGGDPKNVVVLGLIGTDNEGDNTNVCDPLLPPDENLQMQGAQVSERLMEFVGMFKKNGFIGDVCADSYGEFFKEAVGVIDLACDEKPVG